MPEEYTAIDGDRIDRLVYKKYGSMSYLQDVLDANPGLAATPVLTAGTVVYFPQKTVEVESSGKLWG